MNGAQFDGASPRRRAAEQSVVDLGVGGGVGIDVGRDGHADQPGQAGRCELEVGEAVQDHADRIEEAVEQQRGGCRCTHRHGTVLDEHEAHHQNCCQTDELGTVDPADHAGEHRECGNGDVAGRSGLGLDDARLRCLESVRVHGAKAGETFHHGLGALADCTPFGSVARG